MTGGSRGIGRAIVRRFVEEEAKVYFTYLSSKPDAVAVSHSTKNPEHAIAMACDVRRKEEVEKTVEAVLEKESSLDILINNAGVIRDGLLLTMPEEDWSDVLETNLGGVALFSKAVARQMILQGGGRMINISSVVAELGGFGQANYAASKGAINAFTRSLALELAAKSTSVFSIQLIQDWLALGEAFGGDPWENRINFPGTMGDQNWSLVMPISLEEMKSAAIHKTIKNINVHGGRV